MQSLASSTPQNEDFGRIREWTNRNFSTPGSLPISFLYGGDKIVGIPDNWQPAVRKRRIDSNLVETVFEGMDPTGSLQIRVELQEFLDFPVIEWIVWLKNVGTGSTPILKDLMGLEGSFAGETPVLQHCNGDFYSADGYTPVETALEGDQVCQFSPTGGRSCDGAFPYFRLQFAGHGINLAVGWPGQWSAVFRSQSDGVSVSAGQERTHLRLNPGESIRTPRMTVLAWNGDSTRGINLWRRWYLAHILPKPNGKPLSPKLACAATEGGEEFTNASEENQVRLMNRFHQTGIDFDIWWIDAGWYPCRNEKGEKIWWRTGSWVPDPDRFPRSFKPVADHAESLGARLLVWFEPERVYAGSQLDVEHPEWLLKTRPKAEGEADQNRLLDLGNPICRTWLTEHVCKTITEGGISVYRQDFNFPPLDYWRDNDEEDRQGIHENFHVQGYLKFWDDLLWRNPGLWIDSCSSGGRRNDLETMRRSVPLHYTDFGYGNHAIKLSFHHTLYAWIPYFKEFSLSWDVCEPGEDMRFDKQVDRFSFHCGMAAMLFATLDIRRDDYDFGLAKEMVDLWRKTADTFLFGDYYPLTPYSKSNDRWEVWQFERPEVSGGLLQGIRLAGSPDPSITVFPHVLSETANYHFENPETQETIDMTGSALKKDGFTLKLSPRSGAIWLYRVI